MSLLRSATPEWAASALEERLPGGEGHRTALTYCLVSEPSSKQLPRTVVSCEEFETFLEDEIKRTFHKNFQRLLDS